MTRKQRHSTSPIAKAVVIMPATAAITFVAIFIGGIHYWGDQMHQYDPYAPALFGLVTSIVATLFLQLAIVKLQEPPT